MNNVKGINIFDLANRSQLSDIANQWLDWTPTLTWTTATPSTIVTKARYKQIGKTVLFNIKITATDGLGATGLNISLPIAPKNNGLTPMPINQVGVNGAFSVKVLKIRDDGVNNDLNYIFLGTLTTGQGAIIQIQGHYEVN